jgi:hypothetical protein
MQTAANDVIRHRTAFQERVTYPSTGRVVIRHFETAHAIVPYDIVIVAEGNKGTVPSFGAITGNATSLCA